MSDQQTTLKRDHNETLAAIRERIDLLESHLEGLVMRQTMFGSATVESVIYDDSDGFDSRFDDYADNADSAVDEESRRWLLGS